jgi:hypothetical protein
MLETLINDCDQSDVYHICCVHAASAELKALGYDRACQVRWCWADTLFMAPPGWTAFSRVTGDPKYLEYSDREFWATTDYLYRKIETGGGLFLRDSRFFTQKDANGNMVYWSRGNGWVFSGLTAIIDALPVDFPSRPRCDSCSSSATIAPCCGNIVQWLCHSCDRLGAQLE